MEPMGGSLKALKAVNVISNLGADAGQIAAPLEFGDFVNIGA